MGMLIAAFLTFSSTPACAQEFRATLTGQVTDPSGGVVPGATVTAVKNDTQQTYTAKTNVAGVYYIPYMLNGLYTVTVKARGFSTFVQEKVLLSASQTYGLNARLVVGATAQKITVTSAPPLVQTATGSGGTILTGTSVDDAPLNGRDVYQLTGTTPGSQYQIGTYNPYNEGMSGWDYNNNYEVGGGMAYYTDFSMNGANIGLLQGEDDDEGSWTFAPNVDAVQEVNVMSDEYDARYGRSGGALVNIVTKGGTNQFHGDLYEYLENSALDGNTFTDDINDIAKPFSTQNQFGGTFGGPIKKDKIFFFVSFEGFRSDEPYGVTDTLPTAAMKNGDFSGTGYDIFNPSTIQCGVTGGAIGNCPNNDYVSTEFPNDTIPAALMNKTGSDILSYYPSPTLPGISNNYVVSEPEKIYFNQPMARLDWTLNDRNRLYATYMYEDGAEHVNESGLPGVAANGGGLDTTRNIQMATLDLTHTFSPTMIGDFKASFNRYVEDEIYNEIGMMKGGPEAFGLSYPLGGTSPSPNEYPQFSISGLPELFDSEIDYKGWTDAVLDADFTKIEGRNSIEFGGEWGYYSFFWNPPEASPNGDFSFGGTFTQYNPTSASALPPGVSGVSGNAVAAVLLGDPTGGGVDWDATVMQGQPMWDIYGQDNIRVNKRLTLNIGLRYDVEQGVKDRFDTINRGMCLDCLNPDTTNATFEANMAAESATYAADYINTGLLDPIRGGLLFEGTNGQPSDGLNTDWGDIGPRLGFAYMINPKTVIRGGWGWMYAYNTDGVSQDGFNITTSYVDSLNGITPTSYFSSGLPFPSGIEKPAGSSQGLLTDIGNDIGGIWYPGQRIPRVQVQSIGVQRELPGHTVLDVKYSGNYARNLTDNYPLDSTLPLTGGPVSGASCGLSGHVGYAQLQQATYNSCVAELYDRQVPNPYYGVVPSNTSLGSSPTVSAYNLMVPNSAFGALTQSDMPMGRMWFDALEATLQKRLYGTSRGLSFLVSYTYSKVMSSDGWMDSFPWRSATQEDELTNYDRTNVLTWSGVWDMPWGQGAKYLAPNAHGVLGALINNWKASWILTEESGPPISLDTGVWKTTSHNYVPAGGPTFEQWVYNCNGEPENCFESIPAMGQVNQPNYIGYIRQYSVPDLDFSAFKDFKLTESKSLEVRADFFNLTNTPYFGSGPDMDPFANGGQITKESNGEWEGYGTVSFSQSNFPRYVQLNLKFTF
jgi:hypothetical protein